MYASTASWINVLAGIWLIFAPFVLGYTQPNAVTNDIILGIVIGILALIRVFSPLRSTWLSIINILLGLWLIAAPFVLGYTNSTPFWNDIIVGIIVAVMALWSSSSSSSVNRPTQI